jgi:lipid II:glycine glycyltransferase (peptidoglycan interpeptide bridge formation enzyme)
MHEHAEDTHLLDLNKTEEELLANMKKKDRYYINRAIKEGVEIIK